MASVASVAINGYYGSGAVGVASTTRCLLDLGLLAPTAMRTPRVPNESGRRKLAFELAFQFRPSVRLAIHPYFAAACSSRAAVFIHDAFPEVGPPDRLHQMTATRARCLVTVSKATQVQLRELYGREFQLFTQYPDAAWFTTNTTPEYTIGRIAYWGGSAPRKSLPLIRELAGAGLDVWSTSTLADDAATPRPISLVDLIAQVDRSQVAVYPSKAEGFGLPVYEAALRGVPVVLRRLAAYDDFIRIDDAQGTFGFDDDDEFPDAVQRALSWHRDSSPLPALHLSELPTARELARRQLTQILAVCGINV